MILVYSVVSRLKELHSERSSESCRWLQTARFCSYLESGGELIRRPRQIIVIMMAEEPNHDGGVNNFAYVANEANDNVQEPYIAQYNVSRPRQKVRIQINTNGTTSCVGRLETDFTSVGNPSSTEDAEPMDFDDVLPFIGECGTYQIALFFLTAPFCFFMAFVLFSQVFITLIDVHTCHVPQLNDSGLNITQK